MAEGKWQIFIDTGGTFTDCIAFPPTGIQKRLKVLSNSTLAGKITKVTGLNSLQVQLHYDFPLEIIIGYTLTLLSNGFSSKVTDVLSDKKIIFIEDEMPEADFSGATFEMTAFEEVPVLAARILTETSLNEQLPSLEMRLGSTKGTNALLEKKGAKVLLLVTEGHKDMVVIGTQQRKSLFDLHPLDPEPLYSEVLEVRERMSSTGIVLKSLGEEEIERVIALAKQHEVAAVAIALLNSYANPAHEKLLGERLKSSGFQYVSCSAALSPNIKILQRAQTAIVNAYLSPVINNYINNITGYLAENTLKIMTSAGGLVGSSVFYPKDSLLSGPAGGVVGAAKIAQQAGVRRILTLDMGGTSTDVAHYNGKYDYQYETEVGDAILSSPCLSIETIAAGGGSICSFDGHKLTVGPESAGAFPGPACYGKGGPLTITDVNLLLGRLDPGHFGIPVHVSKSLEALSILQEEIKGATGKAIGKDELLSSFLLIANEKMAEAIKKISVMKGYAPEKYALLAFGGAGGQHCCAVASIVGISSIIVPYDAGLLSAYGIGMAEVERFAEVQIMNKLSEISPSLPKWVSSLQLQAKAALTKEGLSDASISIRDVLLYLRLLGQENTIELNYAENIDLEQAFKNKYEQLYGHWIEGQIIEVESIKVIAVSNRDKLSITPPSSHTSFQQSKKYIKSPIDERGRGVVTYEWEALVPGEPVKGPAVIASRTSTIVIEKGWNAAIDSHYNITLLSTGENKEKPVPNAPPEAAALELFTNRFVAVAEEMGALLQRTSFSVNVKERLDFSCAVLDEKGELVVNAPHIPVHLGSLGICVREVRAQFPMQEGDVIITNHPAYGGSHLPDVTLISPVFYQDTLVGYVVNRAHHAEIGGKKPGSMPADASCLEEEGVVIRPTYFVKQGEVQWDTIHKILTGAKFPTRALQENIADLNGALASIHAGKKALISLCDKFGLASTVRYMGMLKAYAASCMESKLKEIGKEVYSAEEELDDGAKLCVMMTVKENKLHIDFEGTADTHTGNMNATKAIVHSVVLYILRLLVDEDIPLNEGLLQPVSINIPTGMLNPSFKNDDGLNPAVVGGNTEVSQRLTDTMLKALNLAACSQGTMNNLLFGNDKFGYYETICGGVGASEGYQGASGVHQHMTNTRITDPEILEFRYPVRLMRFGIRENSGGTGRWNGGDGTVREIKFLSPVELTILAQHRNNEPYGLAGGASGKAGEQWLLKPNGEKKVLSGATSVKLSKFDTIVMCTPGGGGYGEP